MQADTTVEYLDRLVAIRAFAGMAGISHGALSLLAERSTYRRFSSGERVYTEGSSIDWIYLVLDGRLEQRRHGVVSATLGPNEVCGAITVFAGNRDAPDTVASGEATTLQMPAADTIRIFRENFDLTLLALTSTAIQCIVARAQAGDDAGYGGDVCHLPMPRDMTTYADRLEYLAKSLPFAIDRLDALSELARATEIVRLAEGTRLWSPGDPASDFVIPIAGDIECETATQRFLVPVGETMGLLETLGDLPRWHSARARTPVVAARLEVKRLLDVLEDFPDLALRLVSELAIEVAASRKTRCALKASLRR